MKPAPFTYHAPRSKPELLDLAAGLEDARLLAGGQSLAPMLNLRLAMPEHLIDLNRVEALSGIALSGDHLVIGAMTRQRAAELSPLVRRHCPLLTAALRHVGFQQTRNRGTVGGSVAHMDPTAELVAAAYALDAVLTLESAEGVRRTPVRTFNAGYLSSTIEEGEVLTRLDFPVRAARHGAAFEEVTRRGESFSVVSVAALFELDDAGAILRAEVAVGGLGPEPVRLPEAAALAGADPDAAMPAALAQAAGALAAEGDFTVSADYKQHLAKVLTERAAARALQIAREESNG